MGSLSLGPVSGVFARTVTSGSESISTTIDSMKLPFENELEKYVIANAENISGLIDDMRDMLDDLKDLNLNAANLLLDPSVYNVAYTSTLLTNVTTVVTANLADSGTGIGTSTEADMISRARARVNFDAGKEARRIINMNAKMLPYSGGIAVKLAEADRNHTQTLNDMNWRITEKQADMTYAFNRAKVAESMNLENLKITEKHQRLAQHLQAMIADDEHTLRQTWNKYELEIKRLLSHVQIGIDFALKAAGGADQITFNNWKAMAAMMAEGELRIAGLISNLMPGGSLT